MVLMSDTGGGHRASAEALKAGFDILYGDNYKVNQLSGTLSTYSRDLMVILMSFCLQTRMTDFQVALLARIA